ncbi:hypothetical protein P9477_23740 [Enterobacter mori]|uniref:hypothetical protein n=1 Tax=Enterobacter mori TaxID=539813 RepID=UPI00398AAC5E
MAYQTFTYTINKEDYQSDDLSNVIKQLTLMANETSKSPIELYSSIFNRIRYETNKDPKVQTFTISFMKPIKEDK